MFTKPSVVNFMLDALGLGDPKEVRTSIALEPCCGDGNFVVEYLRRCLANNQKNYESLQNSIVAVDVDQSSLQNAKRRVTTLLLEEGLDQETSRKLAENWFIEGDFLEMDFDWEFTHVFGNPPYIRIEDLTKDALTSYRHDFVSMSNRADLYVAFFEKSLSLLSDKGRLSFICTDRWTKNLYGRNLRNLISENYFLEALIDLYGVDAFEQTVMTYPAITQIAKARSEKGTLILSRPENTNNAGKKVWKAISNSQVDKRNSKLRRNIVDGFAPWITAPIRESALINRIENEFGLIEEAGCQVSIGAATGANKVFVLDEQFALKNIERSRLLPVVTASELRDGRVNWKKKYIVNTFEDGKVVNLSEYPRLKSYLESNRELLSSRHVAKKNPKHWFKTIDKVDRNRAEATKLLIPDIADKPVAFVDEGRFHPNNSLYCIFSRDWNIYALKVVFLSSLSKLFITSYSTRIAKNYFRFQAQHLRRIRLPKWDDVDDCLRKELVSAGKSQSLERYEKLVAKVYGLTKEEIEVLECTE